MSTTDPEPAAGNVLDFPINRPGTDLEPAAEVLDAEIVDETTLVDQPQSTDTDDSPLTKRLAELTKARRPILASWLRSWTELLGVIRWAATHTGHIAAFHTVRVPIYAGTLLLRSPRGLLRVIAHTAAWASDAEGQTLRAQAVEGRDQDTYLKLKAAQPRGRYSTLVLGTCAIAAVVLTVVDLAPVALQLAAAAALVGVLGWIGTPTDKSVLGRAVVTYKAEPLTSDIVVRALGALGISQINKALSKGGHGITFPSPIVRDGPGWLAEIDLPFGVTVNDILDKRAELASGLRRPLGCVWPEPDPEQHAGRLRLWVGQQDMRKARQASWPLKRSGQANVFEPLPFGTDQRGRVVPVRLIFANLLLGAMPRQGKTAALRLLLLGLALDPNVELRIFELKGTGDLSPLEPVCHHYASGAGDEALEATMVSLRELVTELEARAKRISSLATSNRALVPDNKVTPEVSSRRALRLWPIVFAIDECQELFSHPEFKDEAARLCTRLIKLGPALGIVLLLATQRPDNKSLPTGISDNVSLRFCLKVAGQVANDMVLGTSSYQEGIRATEFTPELDAGIGYLRGASPEPKIVRTFYLDGPAADKVIVRARALREAAGTLTGHATGQVLDTDRGAALSLLADVLSVIRVDEDKLWSETIVDRLAVLRPDVYGDWARQKPAAKATQLAAALKPYGIETDQQHGRLPNGKTANRRGVVRQDVAAAHAVHRARHRDGG
jgi:S-DNA-T family DNA segregation ATPase FtsK/SpoIIIE